jgi:hypothetical protein
MKDVVAKYHKDHPDFYMIDKNKQIVQVPSKVPKQVLEDEFEI